jgi:hypothetical protein
MKQGQQVKASAGKMGIAAWHGGNRHRTKGEAGEANYMKEPEYVDPSKLRPGPIRHETLPPNCSNKSRPSLT